MEIYPQAIQFDLEDLEIDWNDVEDYWVKWAILYIEYKDGSPTERWPRSLLIEMNGIPIQYGAKFAPIWSSRRGVTTTPPDWASSIRRPVANPLQATTGVRERTTLGRSRAGMFARRISDSTMRQRQSLMRQNQRMVTDYPPMYVRNIDGRVYSDIQNRVIPDKFMAQKIASSIRRRSNGLIGVRTIKTSGGWRNYIGWR